MKIRDLVRPEAKELSAPAGNLKDAAAYQAAGTFSRLMVMLMDPDFCNKLRNVSDPEEFLQITDRQEAENGLYDQSGNRRRRRGQESSYVYGSVKIMLPLITTQQEITEARRLVSKLKRKRIK